MRELSALNNYFDGAYYFSRPRHQGIALLAAGAASQTKSVSPPSLWPGRELRKYHYCPWRIIAHTVAVRIYVLLALACQTKWIAACHQRNERAPLCGFQGSLKMGIAFMK